MKRKVIQFGESTHVITLPCKWLKKHSIKKGDELDIDEDDHELRISSQGVRKNVLRTQIDLTDIDEVIADPVLSFIHKKGYSEIQIKSNSPKVINRINKKVPSLMGFEMIEQNREGCTIRNITEGFESELERISKRIFALTLDIGKKSLCCIKERDNENQELLNLSSTNYKLTSLCQRILNTSRTDTKNRYMYNGIWLMEGITSDFDGISKIISEKTLIDEKTVLLFEEVNDLMQQYIELYNAFSLRAMSGFIKRHKILSDKLLRSLQNGPTEPRINALLVSIVRRIGDFSDSTLALKAGLEERELPQDA